jgi:fatty-acyl-CoA synthase
MGQRLGERQVGQIVARGRSITQGYFQEPELTAATYKPLLGDDGGPWLHTGDLGYFAAGRLFVCGRVKDIVIVRGRNYYPSDIEWAVSELPGVRRGNVVAFGVPVDGEEQLVVCCEGAASDAATIQEATATCIAAQFGLAVHEVVVAQLASLPRTSSGKPQRRKTRELYLSSSLPRAGAVRNDCQLPQRPHPQRPQCPRHRCP